jgi:hypothetical protein
MHLSLHFPDYSGPLTRRITARRVGRGSSLLLLLALGLTGLASRALAQTSPQTFNYTGAEQTFTVPAGVTTLHVVANGAKGSNSNGGSSGGSGGKVEADLAVTPGQVLTIYVGQNAALFSAFGGTFGGGGGGPYAGGGATDIRIGGTGLANRVLVAGGGGGAGDFGAGGAGGGLTGADGGDNGSGAARGGTQSSGGDGIPSFDPNAKGSEGKGGEPNDGGGGGGGYYGGGGGKAGAGGGSSYTDPTLVTNVVHTQGANGGDGSLELSWAAAPALAVTLSPTSLTYGTGERRIVRVTITGGITGTTYGVQLFDGPADTGNDLTNDMGGVGSSQGSGNAITWGNNASEYVDVYFEPGAAGAGRVLSVINFDDFNDNADSAPFDIQDCTPTVPTIAVTPGPGGGAPLSATLTASATATPITYRWNTGETTAVIQVATTGTYSVTTTTNVCTESAQTIITQTELPVTLRYVNGRMTDAGALIGWATAREDNNARFQIERSRDAVSFESIATVPSQAEGGNSVTELTYSYLDTAPLPGINYYRLVQTDRDGTATRSKIIALTRDGALVPVLYPNPVSAAGEAVLEPAVSHSGYQISDVLGRVVQRVDAPGVLGRVSLAGLPSGVYVLTVQTESGPKVWRVLR